MALASMGPPHFRGGRPSSWTGSIVGIFGFNGAASFQRRKEPSDDQDGEAPRRFNGAASFQRRKEHSLERKQFQEFGVPFSSVFKNGVNMS